MDYGKKTYDLFTRPLSQIPSANSLASRILSIDTVYKVLVTDAEGLSLAVDIATINANTQYLYTDADATLANVTVDSILAQICAVDGDISDYDDNTMSLEALNIDLDAIIVDTDELQTDWTNGGRLDNLVDELTTQGDTNETKLDNVIAVIECGEATGTLSYLDAGGEQTILEQTISTRRELKSIYIDTVDLIQDGTLKFYHKIDTSNYRELVGIRESFTVASDDGILVRGFSVNNDWKMTWTEGGDEGANRDIIYNVIYQEME